MMPSLWCQVSGLASCVAQPAAAIFRRLPWLLAQGAGGVKVTETSGKNYIVEILVTVALFGLALWVVCKSSRRV